MPPGDEQNATGGDERSATYLADYDGSVIDRVITPPAELLR